MCKSLKEAGAIMSGKKAIGLFVLSIGAHDDKDVTAIRGIFPSQLKVGPEGFEVVR